jgi:flagellar motility protein MotE (MotC chaperone)
VKNIPRILPLAGVAIGGVLALNALAGAKSAPAMLSGARAWAEETAKAAIPGGTEAKSADAAGTDASAKALSSLPPGAAVNGTPSLKPPVCAPSDLDLAKEAGLSPAELRVLQTLGARRGELDQREQDLDVQLQLLAAAEAKLDAKVKALAGLKTDIQGLIGAADAQQDAEVNRMVAVFTAMKAKDAAARLSVLSDEVRLPIAAKIKERSLSAILAQMSPTEAKVLTEKLAGRFAAAKAAAAGAQKTAEAAADATPGAVEKAQNDAKPLAAKPAAKPAPRKQAAAKPPAKAADAPTAAKSAAATPAPATPAAAPAPKAGERFEPAPHTSVRSRRRLHHRGGRSRRAVGGVGARPAGAHRPGQGLHPYRVPLGRRRAHEFAPRWPTGDPDL